MTIPSVLRRPLIASVLLLLASPAGRAAGQAGVVSGVVADTAGAPVAGVVVTLAAGERGEPRYSAVSGADGGFRMEGVPPGDWWLEARIIGHRPLRREIRVGPDGISPLRLILTPEAVRVRGLEVEADRARVGPAAGIAATVHRLEPEDLEMIPGLAEADVLRAVEVLPGVVSTSDFSSAFNVRGGSADQNLILLDGIPVYNPFHLGGLFSVFNADMVSRAELVAGAMPARYGGRVSSVLTVETDPGGTGLEVDGGVSLLATRAAVGVDLPDGAAASVGLRRARLRASVRRSYFDAVLAPILDFPYHLMDVQLHGEGWTPAGGRITLTAYTGEDVLDFREPEDDGFPLRLRWDWGNDVLGARLIHPLPGAGQLDVTGGYSRFATAVLFPELEDTRFTSRIEEGLLHVGLGSGSEARLGWSGGVSAERIGYHNLAAAGGTVFRENRESAWGMAAYLQATWSPGPWSVEAGGRWEGWLPSAGAERWLFSPRVALARRLPGGVSLRAAAGRYAQYLHSLRDEEVPLGIDIWVITGSRAPPVVSDQVQLGVEAPLGEEWSASLEAYRRTFDGVVTNNFADDPNDATDDLLAGEGDARGFDVLVRRDGPGRVTGWLALSWLKATRRYPDPLWYADDPPLLEYPPLFDRRIDLDLVLSVRLPADLRGGLRWNYGTGLPYTRPLGAYGFYEYELISGGRVRPRLSGESGEPSVEQAVYLGPRNGERYPPYHRLDLSLRRVFRTSWGRVTPYLEVLNVYDRRNVLFYFFDYDDASPTRSGVSMFPVLPTFGAEVSW